MPPALPEGGVALAREWTADVVEISCSGMDLDGLLLVSDRTEELAGMLIAALRLDLPTVCAPQAVAPFSASLVALGLAPLAGEPAGIAAGSNDLLPPRKLVDDFSLANALRAGLSAGGGPGLLVHLAAVAREAGVAGFPQMARVLAPETPAAGPAWLREHGVPVLLASLGDALHDTPTVSGRLKELLPPAPPAAYSYPRLAFVRGRASGAEAVYRLREDGPEAAGECRVFGSEGAAVDAVRAGEVGRKTTLVVGGCGPRGGPGLLRLDALGLAIREAGLEAPVLTDGLAPDDATGAWVSLFTPEAAAGGVLGRLRNGDSLRVDPEDGRIRTGVRAHEFEGRRPREFPDHAGPGYAARYARAALPALEGAGFG